MDDDALDEFYDCVSDAETDLKAIDDLADDKNWPKVEERLRSIISRANDALKLLP